MPRYIFESSKFKGYTEIAIGNRTSYIKTSHIPTMKEALKDMLSGMASVGYGVRLTGKNKPRDMVKGVDHIAFLLEGERLLKDYPDTGRIEIGDVSYEDAWKILTELDPSTPPRSATIKPHDHTEAPKGRTTEEALPKEQEPKAREPDLKEEAQRREYEARIRDLNIKEKTQSREHETKMRELDLKEREMKQKERELNLKEVDLNRREAEAAFISPDDPLGMHYEPSGLRSRSLPVDLSDPAIQKGLTNVARSLRRNIFDETDINDKTTRLGKDISPLEESKQKRIAQNGTITDLRDGKKYVINAREDMWYNDKIPEDYGIFSDGRVITARTKKTRVLIPVESARIDIDY